jgi:Cyclic nucleotide-binding domain
MPERRGEPVVGPGWVRFAQTWGGRTALNMAKATLRPPFVRFDAPVAWTTLELTLHADGRVDGRLAGASPFPRHWVYDADGRLDATSAITDWKGWAGSAIGVHTPWGEEDSPAFVTAVESALERELAEMLLRDTARPAVRRLRAGEVLTRQGDPGDELYIIVDGVLVVSVDGTEVVELGPGAVLGERAVLQGGLRTATLTAGTPAKVMIVPAERVDRDRLAGLAASHRRELPLRHR